MTTKKGKITDRNNFAIEPLFPRYVGYADYFLATPVSVQVRNDSSEAVTLQVSVESESGLLVPYETQAEVPFESSVELTAEGNRLRAEARSGEDACRESEARSGEDARLAAVQAEDPAGSFRSGCAGILVRDGSHVILERMRIRPASCR